MALLVKYKCEQTILSMFIYEAQGNIKHVININNKSIQKIKH